MVNKWSEALKTVDNDEKKRSKVMCTFIKMHKNTQNPLRVLPDTPLTAHFYRLKRRFLTVFFIAKQVFFGRNKSYFFVDFA